ncbi:MAG TPA: hypothetical protein DCS43_01025 [Verrucomicrobia bacterium]|nr:hypothetical protein [Verrucomicrobiota bacterium]
MNGLILLVLALVVIATMTGVLYGFFRRLRRIETELWGEKQREAVQAAAEAAADGATNGNA